MKIAIISLTEKGRILSADIEKALLSQHHITRYCFSTHSDDFSRKFDNIYKLTEEIFLHSDALIFVCACGIAVRAVSAFVSSKISDPAVIVADDGGKFVIPVLSGHIGGANRLAEAVAEKINALAVVTTATDIGRKFSPDSFAMANGLLISDMKLAKKIAVAVLDGEKIGLFSEYECRNIPDVISYKNCRIGICISDNLEKKPFSETLNLVPKNIVVGVGCKKNIPCEIIGKRIAESLDLCGISHKRVCRIATVDIKFNEKGLNEYCEKNGLEADYFTADELSELQGNFTSSEFVRKTTGTDNVCERSAVKSSGGRLIMRKNSADGVTVALAEKPFFADFERKIL